MLVDSFYGGDGDGGCCCCELVGTTTTRTTTDEAGGLRGMVVTPNSVAQVTPSGSKRLIATIELN